MPVKTPGILPVQPFAQSPAPAAQAGTATGSTLCPRETCPPRTAVDSNPPRFRNNCNPSLFRATNWNPQENQSPKQEIQRGFPAAFRMTKRRDLRSILGFSGIPQQSALPWLLSEKCRGIRPLRLWLARFSKPADSRRQRGQRCPESMARGNEVNSDPHKQAPPASHCSPPAANTAARCSPRGLRRRVQRSGAFPLAGTWGTRSSNIVKKEFQSASSPGRTVSSVAGWAVVAAKWM